VVEIPFLFTLTPTLSLQGREGFLTSYQFINPENRKGTLRYFSLQD
jgi:hypothetical protein